MTDMKDIGLGPPGEIGKNITSSITSTLGYVLLLIAHVSLDISLIIIMLLILTNPAILRAWQTDLVIAGLAIIDIWVSKRL